jgi:hypothetical protein
LKAEHRRDRGVVETFDPDEQENLPIVGSQTPERTLDVAEQQARLEVCRRARNGFEHRLVDFGAETARVADVSVASDGEQPCAKIRIRTKLGSLFREAQERVLDEIIG